MIKISLLGEFSVSDTESNAVLTDVELRSDMIKKLFIYMVLHRDHPVSVQELSDALWVEDETDNPQGALKNLMYRMRTSLKKVFGDTQFFKTNLGSYSFNDELPITVDVDEFERLIKNAKKASDNKKKIKIYENAVALYNGDFYEGKGDRSWIVTSATFYHSLFLSLVKDLSSLYMEEGMYKEAETLLNLGLRYDNVDESLHCQLVRSIIKQGNIDLANEAYTNARRIMQKALGVKESKNLRAVHEEILAMSKGTSAESLADIQDDMMEEEEPDGAFLCGYGAFKEIYRLENRKAERLGTAEYVLLLTLNSLHNYSESDGTYNFLLNKAVKQLEHSVCHSLRIGDVAAKYSDTQYIVLLPTCTYETTKMVTDRILDNFKNAYKGALKVDITSDFEELGAKASALVV